MAAVSWDSVSRFVQQAYAYRGRVERPDCLDLAFANNAPDEVVDALDAIGSRVFPTPEAAREFLVKAGYITPG